MNAARPRRRTGRVRVALAAVGVLCAALALAFATVHGADTGHRHAAIAHHHVLVTAAHAVGPSADRSAAISAAAPVPRGDVGVLVREPADAPPASAAVPAVRTRGPPAGR